MGVRFGNSMTRAPPSGGEKSQRRCSSSGDFPRTSHSQPVHSPREKNPVPWVIRECTGDSSLIAQLDSQPDRFTASGLLFRLISVRERDVEYSLVLHEKGIGLFWIIRQPAEVNSFGVLDQSDGYRQHAVQVDEKFF